eukprot:7388874-Prymnesium_polylepis.2
MARESDDSSKWGGYISASSIAVMPNDHMSVSRPYLRVAIEPQLGGQGRGLQVRALGSKSQRAGCGANCNRTVVGFGPLQPHLPTEMSSGESHSGVPMNVER